MAERIVRTMTYKMARHGIGPGGAAGGEGSLGRSDSSWVRNRRSLLTIAFVLVTLLPACKAVTIEEARALRARRTGTVDAPAYVAALWNRRAVPELRRRTVQAPTLLSAIDADWTGAGSRFGRQAGEGAAWTFVVNGEGTVSAIDRRSRRGTATIALDGGSPGRMMVIQLGPVIAGTAVRDSLPFVAFDDFADQLAYADVGRALTDRAVAGASPAIRTLNAGDHVRFAGVVSMRAPSDPLVLTPFALSRSARDDG